MLLCFLGVNVGFLAFVIFLCIVDFHLVKSCFLGVSTVVVVAVFLTGFGELCFLGVNIFVYKCIYLYVFVLLD